MSTTIDFSKYPIRVCRWIHACNLCGGSITDGQRYYDGGLDKRAHVTCVDVVAGDMQAMVRDFNVKFGCERGAVPGLRANELRAKLIEEEARETVDAIRAGDLVETIDGLCDLLYVVFGAADVFGVELAPFFSEVHRTNMLKIGGARREDGKIMKPEGWKPPRIREMLESAGQPVKKGEEQR